MNVNNILSTRKFTTDFSVIQSIFSEYLDPEREKYEIHDYTQTEFGNFGNRGDVDHFQISVKIDGTFIRQGHVLNNIVLLQLFYWYEKLPCQTMQREKNIFVYKSEI